MKKDVALQSLGGQVFKDSGAFTGGWRMRYYEENKEMDNTAFLQKEGDVFSEVENLQDGEKKQNDIPVMAGGDGY